MKIISKLPETGTSIFAVMSHLALQHKAINLSQGFPDYPISEELINMVYAEMLRGRNQYAPMPGVPELREAISAKTSLTCGRFYDPADEVTITSGATQALYTTIMALVQAGDEVIIFEPAYDSYDPAIRLAGGKVVPVSMKHPDYHIDWDEVRRAVNLKTKMIILNSPHNPTGSVLSAADMGSLASIVDGTGIFIMSDEVYEHLIFDSLRHESISLHDTLASRGIAIGSFGKTFHATGWKMGYCLAPAAITREIRKVHQFVVFSSNAPVQYAISEYLKDPAHYQDLPAFFQHKRDLFLSLISASGFIPLKCSGTYFQLLDYSKISDEKEFDFAVRLTKEYGVAAIPNSSFYHNKQENKVLRFCFAKQDSTLEKAAEILCRI